MFQELNVIGRIANDIVLRYSNSGKAVLQIAVIVNNNENNRTTFNFVCFDKYAEVHSNYLSKGDLVNVRATMQNKVEERDGHKNYTYSLYANKIIYLSTKKSKQSQATASEINSSHQVSDEQINQAVNTMTKEEKDPFAEFGEEVVLSDDDLPF